MQASPTGSAGPTGSTAPAGPATPAEPTDPRGRKSRLGRRSLRSWSRWRVTRGGRLARRGSRASARSRSPETQPLDSCFEHNGRRTLRKNITLVECRLLIHDVAVVRSKHLAYDLTFNEKIVELVHGDPEVVVKVVEVQKEVQDLVVCSSRRSAGRCRGSARRSKTPEAGALKTPVSK